MIVVNSVQTLRRLIQTHRDMGHRIGFVPTMGNLHAGHLSLVKTAKQHADIVVVSIFVNPTQFGPNEDFDSYPRTFEQDQALLEQEGADIIFAPEVAEVYPNWPNLTRVQVAELGNNHCGASRPGHFDGVTTVVSKLFNMVRPDCAVFGQKDFQQLAIIRRMTSDLNFDIDIIGAPIVREANGLAMSSRNGYLSTEQKEHASFIYQTLSWMKQQIENGERDYRALEQAAKQRLTEQNFKPDYVHVARQDNLEMAQDGDQQLVLLIAAFMGKVRLIDNMTLEI
ncbi:pantoate--beta-alanine ligase [Kangiella sp.]|uniref:pantoate--beta-alanine ligase n=1 Tax=Kangiella sp. TaxID=1920245 RepID=UPI00198EF740|nr:pantoate--beta-alanine ligase [Kangiella sp.]MBD3654115.1 pantoate--beta-alanine ligase [Kangiella sp.]